MAQSRMQKLFVLLDKGSTTETRKAAAHQIADTIATYPDQLPSVLRKVGVAPWMSDISCMATEPHAITSILLAGL
jgi:hypothetical protein